MNSDYPPDVPQYSLGRRISKDQFFMSVAKAAAQRGTCSRLQVGAALVVEDRIVAIGYNGAPRGELHCRHDGTEEHCLDAVHAETNVLVNAAKSGVSTQGGTLYLTHSPCYGCAGLIINSEITFVVFSDHYCNNDGSPRWEGVNRLVACDIGCQHL